MGFQLPTSTGEPISFHQQCVFHFFVNIVTLPETNIAPESGWLEYQFPFGTAYFQVLYLFVGRVYCIILANGSKIRGTKNQEVTLHHWSYLVLADLFF